MRADKRLFRSNIWKSYLYRFFRNFHFFSGVLIPFFTIWGGITFTQVMILQAIFTFSVFLLEIPTGVVADRFGRKSSLILAGLMGGIGFLVYATYPSFWIFALSEFILAISVSLLSGADQAMIYDSLREIKKEKTSKKIFGRLNSLGLFALMIAAPLGSLIAKYYGLRIIMIFMIIPHIFMIFVGFTFKEPEIGRKIAKKRNYIATLKKGAAYFKNHKILRLIAIDYVTIGVLAFFLVWVYQYKLQSLNVDIGYFGIVHAAIVLVQIIILNTFVNFEKLFGGKRNYLFYSSLLTGIGFITIAFAQTFILAIIGMLIVAAFGLTRKPLFQNYMNKHIKSAERSTVLSTISMFYMFSMALVDIVLGYFVEINMKYSLLIVGLIIISFGIFSKVEEEHLKD